jgi:hypothetical protein
MTRKEVDSIHCKAAVTAIAYAAATDRAYFLSAPKTFLKRY